MGNENDPAQPGSGPATPDPMERGPESAPLEERVARLERELAELRREISVAAPVGQRSAARTPPPPIPTPTPPAANAEAPSPAASRPAGSYLDEWTPATWHQPAAQTSAPRESFENRLGSQIFNRIAIILLLIGTAYFLKLAVDRQWIGPTGRVIAGLIAGAALVVWSERFRRKGFATFSYSLKAVGSGVLYLSLWAAFQLYHLLPAAAALGLMILVTAWNAYMAWVQDSELLAAYALAGGFATPLLVSSGGNHETFLFTYLLTIDIATVALVRLKTWPRLLLAALPLTAAFFIAWYVEYWAADELAVTSIFIVLFGAAFATVPLGRVAAAAGARARHAILLEDILQPLANAAFVALAFYSVLQQSGHHALLPWLMVLLAAAYLALMRVPQTRTAEAIHLSLAVVFLTVAIPLKASGAWLTVGWLVEGLALTWVAARLAASEGGTDAESTHASRILRPLALGALLLGFCGICAHWLALTDVAELPLGNKGTATALIGIAVFATVAWLALRAEGGPNVETAQSPAGWRGIAVTAFVLIALAALLLTLRELALSWQWDASRPAFQNADFFTALIGLAVFAGAIATSLRSAKEPASDPFWVNFAALSTIAFNLIAVLTGVREIEAISSNSPTSASAEAALQQALAISAFLMLYGAALLAVGFWKRSGFLRWQALALLVFTICKTFLYDMRSLSQGYRVVSFLGLGAVLMAISFAYQKDWLNLRDSKPADADPNSHSEAAR